MNKQAEIIAIMTRIQDTSYTDVSSPASLMEYGFELTGYISFTGEAVAEANELLCKAREKATIAVVASLEANGWKISPLITKQFINDKCAREQAYFTLCDRANSCCIHTADIVRSTLSYLKSEMNNLSYAK